MIHTITKNDNNMSNYQLTFDNGQVINIKLDLTNPKAYMNLEAFCVHHIEKNNLTSCHILKPNGDIGRVLKNGQYHWNHNGFQFA